MKEKGLPLAIIKHCNKINEKKDGLVQEKFDADEDIAQIICFNLLQIGELAKNFGPEFVKKYNAVPWKQIKGMRDKVAHGYDQLDMERVWNTAHYDIDPLLDYRKRIIAENENE